jgi:hypothetical protein
MIRTLSMLCLFVLATTLSTGLAQESKPAASGLAVTVPTFQNVTCPIMGKPALAKHFVETPHGRIYMCCKACTKKINDDPEAAYKTAYPTAKKVGNKTCPMSGETLDAKAATVTVQGYEIGLCCSDCSKGVLENSQIVLAKLTNPKIADVGNATCPITGKPVVNNAFVLIGDDLVHLASADAVEQVQKDPTKALAKAKELKAAEDKAGGGKKKEHGPSGCCADKKDDAGCCSGGKAESRPN